MISKETMGIVKTKDSYMRQEIRERKALIASEGPGLAGRRCQEAERGADDKSDEDGGHHRGAGLVVSGAVEDLDKVVASGTGQVVTDVTKAEAESDDDCEAESAVEEDGANHAPGDNGRRVLDFFCHMDWAIVT
jgi:hypothetical protein